MSEKQIVKEKEMDYRFYATLHGFDLDKDKKGKADDPDRKLTKEELFQEARDSAVPIFRDPSYYDHLTQEEREELTQIMMSKHKIWRDQGLNVSSIGGK